MIGDLFIVDDLRSVHMNRDAAHLRHRRCHVAYERWQTVCHIRGQIPAVGARIGAELLFIKALEVVQRLLGGKAKNPVGVALQGGEVVKGRRLFSFVLALDRLYHCHLTAAGFLQGFGLRLILHAFAASIKPRKPQRDRIERLRLESVDFRFLFFGHDLVHGVLRAFALTAELFQPLRLRKRGGVLGILHCIQKLPLFLRLEVRQLHSRIQGNFLGINFLLNLWNKLRQANEPLYLRNAFAAVLRDFFSGI